LSTIVRLPERVDRGAHRKNIAAASDTSVARSSRMGQINEQLNRFEAMGMREVCLRLESKRFNSTVERVAVERLVEKDREARRLLGADPFRGTLRPRCSASAVARNVKNPLTLYFLQ
jgi:hypothetical protein